MKISNTLNASLTYKCNHKIRHVLLLPGQQVTFGRDNQNDVILALFPLNDMIFQYATADISRQHFMITRTKEGYTIQDTGSTNGTSLDCIALLHKKEPLRDGQTIDIGGVLDLKIKEVFNGLILQRMTNTPQESYLLFENEITLGSSPRDTLWLEESSVMPRHASIKYSENRYTLSCGAQDRLVLLGDSPLEWGKEMALKSEEHILVGDVMILFKTALDREP